MRESGRLITNASANTIGQIARLAVGLIIPPFVVSRIGRADYGLVVLIGTILQFVALVDIGVPEAMMRFLTAAHTRQDEHELSRTLSSGAALLLGAALLALLVVLGLMIRPSWFVQLPPSTPRATVRLLVIALGSASALSIVAAIGRAAFYATERFALLNFLIVGETVLRLGLVLLLVGPVGAGILGYAVSRAIPIAVSASVIFAVGRRLLPEAHLSWRHVQRRSLRRMAGFGSEVLFNRSAILLYVQADYLILGRGIGPEAVTVFSLAVVWAQIVRSILGPAVDVALPAAAASDARGDRTGLQLMLIRLTKYTLVLGTPPVVFLMVFHMALLDTWMGPGYGETARVLLLLAIPEIFVLGSLGGARMFIGLGRVRFFTTANTVAGVTNVVLASILALTFHLGTKGIAISYLFIFLARYAIAQPIYLSRSVGLKALTFYRQSYVPPFLMMAVLVPVAWELNVLIQPTGWARLIACASALAIAAAPLAWFLALDAYDRRVVYDLLSPLRRLLHRTDRSR